MINKITVFFILIFIFTNSFGQKGQETLYIDGIEPMFSVTFPDNWVLNKKEGLWVATPKDNTLLFYLSEIDVDNEAIAIANATKNISKIIKDLTNVTMGKQESVKYDKITLTEMKGNAKSKNQPVKLNASIFSSRTKIYMIVYYGIDKALSQHGNDLKMIKNSLVPR